MYIPSHTRAAPYIIGMVWGYVLYRIRTDGIKINKVNMAFILRDNFIYCAFNFRKLPPLFSFSCTLWHLDAFSELGHFTFLTSTDLPSKKLCTEDSTELGGRFQLAG